MGIIKILDEEVSNVIAAGEVVESPSSLVKELLENSIDAGSKSIHIDVKNGGRYIKISDDGSGMDKEDLLMCIERHATSKIRERNDIFNLVTYGFRGEALSSICAVSKTKLSSKKESMERGNAITVLGNKITSIKDISMNRGTEIEVKDLFFNTPARLKFLRKEGTEFSHIKDIVFQEALANPNIAITLTLNEKISISTSGNGIKNAIVEIFGRSILKNLLEFQLGFLGNSSISRASKDSIYVFVNGRVVKSKIIEDAVIDGYYTKLSKGKYPFAIIFLEIDGKEVDVNVHPSKKIVKFSNDINVYSKVANKIREVFLGDDTLTSNELKAEIFKNSIEAVTKNTYRDDFNNNSENSLKNHMENSLKKGDNEVKLTEDQIEKNQLEKKNETDTETVAKTDIKVESSKIEQGEKDKKISNEKIENRKIYEEEKIIFEKKEDNKLILPNKKLEILEDKKKYDNFFEECKKEVAEDNPLDKLKIAKLKVIGQFHNSYIVVENSSNLELYDQHIVHERILYEEYKKEYLTKGIKSQNLLIPQRIGVEPNILSKINNNMKVLESFGFEIEEFGSGEILLRAIPLFAMKESIKDFFMEVLEELGEYGNKDPREGIIIAMSCKAAIKAGEPLKYDEMELLINKLHQIGEYTCPHGRPIILRLGIDEIEKKFKRK